MELPGPESNPGPLAYHAGALYVYMVCVYAGMICIGGTYILMSLNKKWASVERLDVALE